MKRMARAGAVGLLLLAGGSMTSIDARAQGVETATHPYLFFRSEDLPAIRKNAEQYPASKFEAALKKACEQGAGQANPYTGTTGRSPSGADRSAARLMSHFAFYDLLRDNPAWRDKAKEWLLTLGGWTKLGKGPGDYSMGQGEVLRDAAVAYDFLWPNLTDEERSKVETFLAMGAAYLYTGKDARATHWGGTGLRLGNWRSCMWGGIGSAGMALWGKNADAATWVDQTSLRMKAILDYDFDSEGGATEAYERYFLGVTMHYLIPYSEALRRMTGENLFAYNDSVLKKHALFEAYMAYPSAAAGKFQFPSLGDTGGGDYTCGLSLLSAAGEYNDPVASWYLDKLLSGGYQGALEGIWGVLWAKPVAPQDPEASGRLSVAKAFNANHAVGTWLNATDKCGSGWVFLRTGFNDPNDIYFACRAGVNGGYHGHSEAGSYLLSAYGVNFFQDYFSAGYDTPEWTFQHKGEAHNIVTIDGKGQGCEGDYVRASYFDPEYGKQDARVDSLQHTPAYDVVKMDLRKAYDYNHPGMHWAYRSVVFMRGANRTGYYVAIDDMEKDNNAHRWEHCFHRDRSVTFQSIAGAQIVLAHAGGAKLYITPVHPAEGLDASAELTKYGDHYVRLTTKANAQRLVMMTVLYPVKAGEELPAHAPAANGDTLGVTISGQTVSYDKSTKTVSVSGGVASRPPAKP